MGRVVGRTQATSFFGQSSVAAMFSVDIIRRRGRARGLFIRGAVNAHIVGYDVKWASEILLETQVSRLHADRAPRGHLYYRDVGIDRARGDGEGALCSQDRDHEERDV